MEETLAPISFLNKTFVFLEMKDNKIRFKYENQETSELSILEIIYSEKEKIFTKIDLYISINNEVEESLHIRKETKDSYELSYFPSNNQRVKVNNMNKNYQISIYQNYSEVDNEMYQESSTIELTKANHKKHKILTQVPLKENFFYTTDNRIVYVSSSCMEKLEIIKHDLFPSLKELEKLILTWELKESKKKITKEMLDKVINCFPTKRYIYDREYELVGINENAIVYRNMEDDLMEVEIYLDDTLSKVKELRFISYNKNKFLTEGVRKKLSIIRVIPQDDKTVHSSLCSRTAGSMLINGVTHSKCNISAEAIISEETHTITDMNLKLSGKFGIIELKQAPINHREFIDKNDIYYHISSVTYGTYNMLILNSPAIINKFNSFLEEGKEESNAIQLIKKESRNKKHSDNVD